MHTWGRRAHQEGKQPPVVGEVQLRVYARAPVVIRAGATFPVDEHRADGRPAEDVSFNSGDSEMLARNAKLRIFVAELARLHLQKADVVRADFAGDLCAVIYGDGLPIVCQSDASGEK